jgi:hypothetical protein
MVDGFVELGLDPRADLGEDVFAAAAGEGSESR